MICALRVKNCAIVTLRMTIDIFLTFPERMAIGMADLVQFSDITGIRPVLREGGPRH